MQAETITLLQKIWCAKGVLSKLWGPIIIII